MKLPTGRIVRVIGAPVQGASELADYEVTVLIRWNRKERKQLSRLVVDKISVRIVEDSGSEIDDSKKLSELRGMVAEYSFLSGDWPMTARMMINQLRKLVES